MRHFAKFVVIALLAASPAHAQLGKAGSATASHDHSSLTRGGGTLAPLSASLAPGTSFTISAPFAVTGSTLTIGAHPVVRGVPFIVASSAPVASQGITIANIEPSSTTAYDFCLNGVQGGAGTGVVYHVQMNGDGGASYQQSRVYARGSIGIAAGSSNNTFTATSIPILLDNGVTVMSNTDEFQWCFTVSFVGRAGDYKTAMVSGHGHYYSNSEGVGAQGTFGGIYHGSAAVTSVRVYPSSGYFGGGVTVTMRRP